jgi:hypothetical protein
MLGLFIPLVGDPYFEYVPDAKRGHPVYFTRNVRSRDEADAALKDKFWHLKPREFEWQSRFVRKNGTELFDIWEES